MKRATKDKSNTSLFKTLNAIDASSDNPLNLISEPTENTITTIMII